MVCCYMCVCDSGDLWPRSVLQHPPPTDHLPRRLQPQAGTAPDVFVLFTENKRKLINYTEMNTLTKDVDDGDLSFIISWFWSFRDTSSATWARSWPTPSWGRWSPVLWLGENPFTSSNLYYSLHSFTVLLDRWVDRKVEAFLVSLGGDSETIRRNDLEELLL